MRLPILFVPVHFLDKMWWAPWRMTLHAVHGPHGEFSGENSERIWFTASGSKKSTESIESMGPRPWTTLIEVSKLKFTVKSMALLQSHSPWSPPFFSNKTFPKNQDEYITQGSTSKLAMSTSHSYNFIIPSLWRNTGYHAMRMFT